MRARLATQELVKGVADALASVVVGSRRRDQKRSMSIAPTVSCSGVGISPRIPSSCTGAVAAVALPHLGCTPAARSTSRHNRARAQADQCIKHQSMCGCGETVGVLHERCLGAV